MLLIKAIQKLRPQGQWSLNGDTYDGLEWFGDDKPTKEEIDAIIPKVAIIIEAEKNIATLEATRTERRLREAFTSDAGKQWMIDLDAKIDLERQKLKV